MRFPADKSLVRSLSKQLTKAGHSVTLTALSWEIMSTYIAKEKDIVRKWHVVNAEGIPLGRLAVRVTNMLRGKDKPIFSPHQDTGDFVIVINAEKVKLTGKKETDKSYMTYSGWKGGEKYRTVAEVRARHPELLVKRAVWGMMPKNRRGRQLITKLKIYKGPEHPHVSQKPEEFKIAA
jgi:large subunit ribosomal protein L13